MNTEQARKFVTELFALTFDDNSTESDYLKFFSPDYTLYADEEILNFGRFVEHLKVLKSTVSDLRIEIMDVIATENRIAEIHIVTGIKRKMDERIKAKVIAMHTLRDGKLVKLEELTYLIEGSEEDRDLGSRR